MVKGNYIFLSFIFTTLYIALFPNANCFPFYNLQSARLQNGNFFFIHQNGVDIVDSDINKIIKNVITFSEEEQITVEKMKDTIIKQFKDGSLICLINDKMYIFDELGNFKQKKEDANNDMAYNYYSLNIKDNYHYFVAFVNDQSLNIYYYEYDKLTNTITQLGNSGHIKLQVPTRRLEDTINYYNFIGGLNCHMMKSEGKEETLACFLIISYNNKNYWNIKFYNLNENNEIIAHTDYSPLQKEQDVTVTHFKVEVNSDKI